MDCNNPPPSSSPSLGLMGDFLDGIFTPDGAALDLDFDSPTASDEVDVAASVAAGASRASSPAVQEQRDVSETRRSHASSGDEEKREGNNDDEELQDTGSSLVVSQSEIRPLDVVCARGLNRTAATASYRDFIGRNKLEFDMLASAAERQEFAADIWEQLRGAGYRFLQPASAGMYNLMTYERSVLKCRQALNDSRTKIVTSRMGKDTVGCELTTSLPVPVPAKKKQKKTEGTKRRSNSFDENARAAISTLLSKRKLKAAMEKAWGDELETRKDIFVEQVRIV